MKEIKLENLERYMGVNHHDPELGNYFLNTKNILTWKQPMPIDRGKDKENMVHINGIILLGH